MKLDLPSLLRRSVLLPLLASTPALAASAPEAAAGAPDRPNIILMIADDLGYGDLGCYGSKIIPTPNIDRLASQGIRFTDAHAAAAVCTPSRYSILTGRNYARYRRNWVGELLVERDRPTLVTELGRAGYATAYFGKWHLGWGEYDTREQRAAIDWNAELPAGVLECGYGTYFGTPFSHNEAPFVFVENRRVIGLEKDDPLVIPPKSEDPGPWGWGNSKGAAKAHAARPQDRIDLLVTGRATGWLREHSGGPFFLQVAFVAPHVPIAPAAEFRGKTGAGPYGDFIFQMDWCVGQILDALEATGQAGRTIVVFTSDNGAVAREEMIAAGHFSNGPLLGQKTDAWEGGHRVPLLVRWPGNIPPGTSSDALVCLADLPRTLWSAAGIQAPEGAAEDSFDLLPVLRDPSAPSPRSEILIVAIEGTALRSGRWLYVPKQGSLGKTTAADPWLRIHEQRRMHSDYDGGSNLKPGAPSQQLYDLAEDLAQSENAAPSHPEKAAELSARHAALMREVRKAPARP